MGNSTQCKIATPENFTLKLCTRDYVRELTLQANFGFSRYSGAFPQIDEMLPPCDFLKCCPVSSLPFFSILRPGRTAGPIFTLYGSNDVFPRKDGPFGVRTMGDVIWGMCPQNFRKWSRIGDFKPKHQNIKIAISDLDRI